MARILVPAAVLAALFACTPYAERDDDEDGVPNGVEEANGSDPARADSDGDGLSDGAEVDAGSDPLEVDTDGDGLTDGDEVNEFGTEPADFDSDGDGYNDGDEVNADSDPMDRFDKIYEGGWPYQSDKDAFEGPAIEDAEADEGELFARMELEDQFGDMLDLYDLAGHGTPIVLDLSAIWCGPCNGLSSWLSGGRDDYGWNGAYPNVKQMVDDGDLVWVTVLGEDRSGGAPDLENIQDWDEDYEHENIPVLVGNDDFVNTYIQGGWPTVYFLNENMEIEAMPVGTSSRFYDALQAANDYQPE